MSQGINEHRVPGGSQAVGSTAGALGRSERPLVGKGGVWVGSSLPRSPEELQGGSEMEKTSGGRGDTCRCTGTI